MVKIKFQDNTYLGFVDGTPSKVTRDKAYIYSTVKSAKTSIRDVFYRRVLKGYNTPTYVDMNDNAHPEWQDSYKRA